MNFLSAYPFATASSAAMYLVLLASIIPATRAMLMPLFTHPTPPHQKYLAGFDALRGFAATFVAFGHCWWATHPVFHSTQLAAPFIGYNSKGVPIFAALSGFLIYRSCLGAAQSVDGLRSYMIRRIFRIYPVYLLGVLLCVVLGQYVATQHHTALSYFLSDVFMLPAISWSGGFANPPTWSLYVEVIFYALLPCVLLLAGRRRMAMLCAVGFLILTFADYPSRVFVLWRYFLVGIIASEAVSMMGRRTALACVGLGLALLIVDLQGPRFDWAARLGIGLLHAEGSTVGLALACGLILAGLPSLPTLGRLLNFEPLRLLGIVSYSVYVTHFFYIWANFPEINFFTQLGTQASYDHFKTLPQMPAWYLPIVFFPGVIFWGCVAFLIVERPGIKLGQFTIQAIRAKQARS